MLAGLGKGHWFPVYISKVLLGYYIFIPHILICLDTRFRVVFLLIIEKCLLFVALYVFKVSNIFRMSLEEKSMLCNI